MHFPTWTQLSFSLSLFAFFAEVTTTPNPAIPSQPTKPAAKRPPPPVSSAADRKYFMVPRKLPLMNFEIPQTFAGLLDLSESPNSSNELFFWYVPTQNPAGLRDLALWTNGGPGCSSMLGGFQENGPIMWDQGRRIPIVNKNSWHNQANMLYVDHPANVGYSTGTIQINNEDQVARYLFRFLQKFLTIFPEMRGANFYLTGESYAGYYVSYAAEYIYRHQAQLALKLQGILLVDAVISFDHFQMDTPMPNFIRKYNDKYLHLSAQVVKEIELADKKCGTSQYIKDNLKFPPSRFLQPDFLLDPDCQFGTKAANSLSKTFNWYNIAQQKGGFDFTTATPNYFDRPDVRKAFNAEHGNTRWVACSSARNIFPKGEASIPPVGRALPYVIDQSKRTVILHGKLDGLLLVEGTILALQGFAWGGKLGFSRPIDRELVVGGVSKGQYQSERKLTFIAVNDAGHMVPHDQPEVALFAFEFLLQRRANL